MNSKHWFRIVRLLPKKLVYHCSIHVAAVAATETKKPKLTTEEANEIYLALMEIS